MNAHYLTTGVRIILILAVVVFLGFVMRDSIGITFATGGLNLKIDSHAVYNGQLQPALTWELKNLVPGVDKFFNFNDVMPGDVGVSTISLHTDEDAWVCMDFTNLVDEDNDSNEPEGKEDPDGLSTGELSRGMEFFGWEDDGDNIYEVGEPTLFGTSSPQAAIDVLKEYIIADASTGTFFPANDTKYIGIQWCAGDQVVDINTATITCDASALGNIAQSDSFSVDLGLRAVKAEDVTNFRCDGNFTLPGVDLSLEKKFSGPVPEGYLPEQFTFRVEGESINQIVTLTPYTKDSAFGTIRLPEGTYSITEIGPVGFVANDWRPGWYGECESGSTFSTSITIDGSNIDDGTLYCQVDNQYRPDAKVDEDSEVLQQSSPSEAVTPTTEVVESESRLGRIVRDISSRLRR